MTARKAKTIQPAITKEYYFMAFHFPIQFKARALQYAASAISEKGSRPVRSVLQS